ncbi:MAG: SAM-dependent methyltransferase [Pseudomonadota bacterium]
MWDERYTRDDYLYGTAPNDFLAEQVGRIPGGGRVLCLADGEGRNSVYLAGLGFEVTAVDFSTVALDKAARLARQQGVSVELQQADLSQYTLENYTWDGIVSIFCHLPPEARRRLHRQIPGALTAHGVLILEAYTPRQLELGTGGPPDAELMMTADALREELTGLDFRLLMERERDVIEGSGHTGRGAVVQAVGARHNIDLDQTGTEIPGPAS